VAASGAAIPTVAINATRRERDFEIMRRLLSELPARAMHKKLD
jgi:hypothetical protein